MTQDQFNSALNEVITTGKTTVFIQYKEIVDTMYKVPFWTEKEQIEIYSTELLLHVVSHTSYYKISI
jgi:hypothetical protein